MTRVSTSDHTCLTALGVGQSFRGLGAEADRVASRKAWRSWEDMTASADLFTVSREKRSKGETR